MTIISIAAALMAASSATASLPLDVRATAADHDCVEIADFFERPGMVDPPYVYGYAEGEKADSVVFWCRSGLKTGKFRLIVQARAKTFTCPAVVKETSNYPGGLSVSRGEKLELSDFKYIDSGKRLSSAPRPADNFIRSYYDGVEDSCRFAARGIRTFGSAARALRKSAPQQRHLSSLPTNLPVAGPS